MQLHRKSLLTKPFVFNLQQFLLSLWIYPVFCCFGLILLVIASTIVLSLIPIYISQHGITINITQEQSQVFYIEYIATTNENLTDICFGFADNLVDATEQITQQFSLRPNIVNIKQIELIARENSGRRLHRQMKNKENIRNKRATDLRLLMSCRGNYPLRRHSNRCRTNYISSIRQRFSKHSNIVLQLKLLLLSDQPIQFTLQYVDFAFDQPSEFTAVSTTSNSESMEVLIMNPIILSLTAVQRLLNNGGYAIISAGRNPAIPSDVSLDDTIIQQRTTNVSIDLTNRFLYSFVLGVYDGASETSFFVILHNKSPDQERAAITALGEKYNQESIIYVQKSIPTIQQLIYTTGEFKGKYVQGQGYTELSGNVTDNYSQVHICPNSSYTFTLNFDFETIIRKTSVIQTRQLIDHHANNRMINQKRFYL